MARSPKIKKKKSFMFTTKHHPFTGILGVVLFALCASVQITSIIYSYSNRGKVEAAFGYYGFFTALLNVIGLISGITGLRERDAFKVSPWIAVVGNSFMLVFWAILLLLSGI